MKRITISIIVVAFSFFVEARLGKTLEECDVIYKNVLLKSERTQKDFFVRNYATPSVAVSCRFHNNKCFEIAVSLLDKDGSLVSITPEQVGSFINLNLGLIPKVASEGVNIGANTIEYALGIDGRYVWREEQTPTGVITILRDNTLAPPAHSNAQQSSTSSSQVVSNDFKRIAINDMLKLSKLIIQGNSSFEFIRSATPLNFSSWKYAAELGVPEGQNLYALCYRWGYMVSSNSINAISWWRKAAEQSYPPAQHNLGFMYAKGSGVQKDEVEAVRWYRKAAEQSYPPAQYCLGLKYEDGSGVQKDEVEALRWYRKAAEQSYPPAQHALGLMYENGSGVQKDEVEALRWYRKAADQGDASSQYILGWKYALGVNVPKNSIISVKWFQMAADQGDLDAQTLLAGFLIDGEGIKQDIPKGLALHKKAADQNHVGAIMQLTEIYAQGKIVSRNYSESFDWCLKAAALDCAYAQFVLGIMYTKGFGVTRNLSEANKWLLKCANKKSDFKYSSCLLLSEFYEKGLGCEVDNVKASYWKKMAKTPEGPLQEYMLLGVWFLKNKIAGSDYKETLKWWSIGAEQGDPSMQALVGFMYESGLGTEADPIEAAKWFSKAEANGHNLANARVAWNMLKGTN